MSPRFFPRARLGVLLAAAMLLGGCTIMDDVNDWFTATHKSKLVGVRVPLTSADDTLKPDPDAVKQPVVLPAPFRNPDWPQPGGYSSNAMYHLEAPGPLKQIWSVNAGKGTDTDSAITATPVVGGGRIYVLDAEAHVYVFRLGDGHPIWDKRLAPKNGTDMPTLWGLLGKHNTVVPATGMGGGVAFDDGKIFVTSGFGQIVVMDAGNGHEIWRRDLVTPILNAPVVKDGRVFVSTHDNHLFAMAEADGRILWEHQGTTEPASILATTSVAVSGEFVVAPYSSGELYALRVQNGQTAWTDVLSHTGSVTAMSEIDAIAGRPVIDRDAVIATSQSGVTVAINRITGDRIWSRDVGSIQTPWVAGDFIYLVTTEAQVVCLTRKDGKIKWVHQLPQFGNPEKQRYPILWGGPVLASNKLVLVSSDGYAEALSPYSGALLGRMELPAGSNVSPIVANGVMYVYTNDADLVALR
jgi:outer membrane protein assembly factor BamB